VDDTVRGLVAFMAAAETSVGDVGPVNIGNPGCEFTMNELVEVFRKALQRPETGDDESNGAFEVKYLPRTQDDPMCRRPVITKAEELFGFKCDVGLEEGIQHVWDYFL
jgi:UDP-glucuronate decarboxylase